MNGKFLNVSLTLMIFFSMVSCEKENVNEPMMDEPVRVTNAEMQRAAEVVAEMVGENAEYFSYIDAAVGTKVWSIWRTGCCSVTSFLRVWRLRARVYCHLLRTLRGWPRAATL